MKNVTCYIDGFNLYHAIAALSKPWLKWLNIYELSRSMLRPGENLSKVNFYTTKCNWNKDKSERHHNFTAALIAYGVAIKEGKFSRVPKWCDGQKRKCKFREEKFTDVAIAVDIISDAHAGLFDRAILVTADHDQIPTVRRIRETFPGKSITLAAPPGRLRQARELVDLASDFLEIDEGRLGGCLLPRTVYADSGVAVAKLPLIYIEPGCPFSY